MCGTCQRAPLLWLSTITGASVVGPDDEHLGHLRDVGLRRTGRALLVEELLVDAGGHLWVLPAETARSWTARRVRVSRMPTGTRATSAEGAPDTEWLARSVVGTPVLTGAARLKPARVSDVGLDRRRDGRWFVSAIDSRPGWQRRLGLPRRVTSWTALGRRGVWQRSGCGAAADAVGTSRPGPG